MCRCIVCHIRSLPCHSNSNRASAVHSPAFLARFSVRRREVSVIIFIWFVEVRFREIIYGGRLSAALFIGMDKGCARLSRANPWRQSNAINYILVKCAHRQLSDSPETDIATLRRRIDCRLKTASISALFSRIYCVVRPI